MNENSINKDGIKRTQLFPTVSCGAGCVVYLFIRVIYLFMRYECQSMFAEVTKIYY